MRICLAVLCFCSLSACYTQAEIDALTAFAERSDTGLELSERVNALSGTRFDAMPTSGSGTFSGGASLLLDPDPAALGDGMLLIGDATLTADFGSSSITGDVSGIEGVRGTSPERVEAFAIADTIAIGGRSSFIGDDPASGTTEAPNAWGADYEGTLSTPLGTLVLDGQLAGRFLGTRINNPNTDFPIKAIEGTNPEETALIDGSVFPIEFDIAAENR